MGNVHKALPDFIIARRDAHMKVKLLFILTLTIALGLSMTASAYPEDYPPYSLAKGPFRQFPLKLIYSYSSKDNKVAFEDVTIEMTKSGDLNHLLVKLGNRNIFSEYDCSPATEVFGGDLDGNGLKDIIIFHNSIANGLGLQGSEVVILLRESNSPLKYMKVSIGNGSEENHLAPVYPSTADFVDIDKDGKCEIIVCGFFYGAYSGFEHNYFTYNVFRIVDFKLVNADKDFAGFPKFVWFSFDPNDMDTNKLPKAAREKHVAEVIKSLQHEEIQP